MSNIYVKKPRHSIAMPVFFALILKILSFISNAAFTNTNGIRIFMRNILFRLIVILAFLSIWARAKIDTELLEHNWFVNDIVSLDTLHQYDPTGLSLSFKEGEFTFSDINGKSSGGTYQIKGKHIELDEGGYKRIIKVINLSNDSLIIENTSPSGSQILRMSHKSN